MLSLKQLEESHKQVEQSNKEVCKWPPERVPLYGVAMSTLPISLLNFMSCDA